MTHRAAFHALAGKRGSGARLLGGVLLSAAVACSSHGHSHGDAGHDHGDSEGHDHSDAHPAGHDHHEAG